MLNIKQMVSIVQVRLLTMLYIAIQSLRIVFGISPSLYKPSAVFVNENITFRTSK